MAGSKFYGWTLLAAFWFVLFVNLAFPAYGSAVLNTYMATDLHLSHTMTGLPYSVYLLMSGLPGPLVALCVNRKGIRFTLILGGLMVTTGSLIMALFVSSGLGAVLAFGLIVGAGVATGGAVGTQTGVARFFVRRRALALSILLSGGGLGGFVAARLLDWVIRTAHGNWRAGWWVVAGLSAIATVVAGTFAKERPEDLGQLPDGATAASAAPAPGAAQPVSRRSFVTAEQWTYAEALRSPALWLMFASALGTSIAFAIILALGGVHMLELGYTKSAAAVVVSTMTISSLLAKAVVATFGDRVDPRYIWAAFAAVSGVGTLLAISPSGPNDLYLFALCIGAGFGGMLVCLMAVLSNYYGLKPYAQLVGLAIAIQTTVSAIAPTVAGKVHDSIGTYTPTFCFVAGVCFAGALTLLAVRPPARHAAAAAAAQARST
jgi:MFS family permease